MSPTIEKKQTALHTAAQPETIGLRRLVLRDDTRTTDVNFDEDETAIHLAVQTLQAGRSSRSQVGSNGIVNIRPSTVYNFGDGKPSELSSRCSTGPSAVSIELGRSLSVDEVWARARDPPSTFTCHGFVTSGPRYIDENTGLAHQSFSHFLKNLVIPRSAARSPLSVMRGRLMRRSPPQEPSTCVSRQASPPQHTA